MERIFVTFAGLRQSAGDCNTISANIGRINTDFQRTVSQLDWEVRKSSNINNIASRIGQSLDGCVRALRDYNRYMEDAHAIYADLENWGTRDSISTSNGAISAKLSLSVGKAAVSGASSGFGIKDVLSGLGGVASTVGGVASTVGGVATGSLAKIFGISTSAAANLGFASIDGKLRVAGNIGANSNVINSNVAGLIRAQHAAKAVNGALTVVGGGLAVLNGFMAPADSTGQRMVNTGVSVGMFAAGKSVGAKVGGAIGTFIPIPVVGTLVGAAAGAAIGIGFAYASNWLVNGGLQTVGNAVVSGAQAVGSAVVSGAQAVGNAVASGARAVTNAIGNLFRR